MNLRILKKLSKRAAPYLVPLGDTREQFLAEKDENYTATVIDGDEYAHPRKGTPMIGAISGYYEPEWDEETTWDALKQHVYWHFTEYDPTISDLVPTRTIKSPTDVFNAADEMLRERVH